jgi:hypothetical protein
MNRRELLIGTVACVGAAAMPAIPIAADPLVRGITWQSWPFGTVASDDARYFRGSVSTGGDRMPLSYFVENYCAWRDDDPIYWEAIP